MYGSSTTRARWNIVVHSAMVRGSRPMGDRTRSAGTSVATAENVARASVRLEHTRRQDGPRSTWLFAAYESTPAYKVVLLLHILSVIVAFGAAVRHAVAGRGRGQGDGGTAGTLLPTSSASPPRPWCWPASSAWPWSGMSDERGGDLQASASRGSASPSPLWVIQVALFIVRHAAGRSGRRRRATRWRPKRLPDVHRHHPPEPAGDALPDDLEVRARTASDPA